MTSTVRDSVLPGDVRPARPDGTCFYCRRGLGTPHADECVCLRRKVRVRFTIEMETDEVRSWDAHAIEFHYNDSSWCANNLIAMLKAVEEEPGCLCNIVSAQYVGEVEASSARREGEGGR